MKRSTNSLAEVRALLFDRDGTLIVNVPELRDPWEVRVRSGVAEALDLARSAGFRLGVVSNQAGIGRGHVTWRELAAVNAEVESRCGPFGTWQVCPHLPGDGCECRKPKPGLVQRAACVLGVPVGACLVVGDRLSDIEAARAAGAQGILVPSEETRAHEIRRARHRASSVAEVLNTLAPTAVLR
jgi:histidinol-phosphate phosphatase family protein